MSDAPAGFIFGCTLETEAECRYRKLFGLPAVHIDAISQIPPGTPLFLYNYDLRVLYGIFESAGRGGWQIDRDAWDGEFPSQIRVKGVGPHQHKGECLVKNVFSQAIRDNYISRIRFKYSLKRSQVRKLETLYRLEGWKPSWEAPWMHGVSEKLQKKSGKRRIKKKTDSSGRRPLGKVQGKRALVMAQPVEREARPVSSGKARERSLSVHSRASDAMEYEMDCDVMPPIDHLPPHLRSTRTQCVVIMANRDRTGEARTEKREKQGKKMVEIKIKKEIIDLVSDSDEEKGDPESMPKAVSSESQPLQQSTPLGEGCVDHATVKSYDVSI